MVLTLISAKLHKCKICKTKITLELKSNSFKICKVTQENNNNNNKKTKKNKQKNYSTKSKHLIYPFSKGIYMYSI